MARGRKAPAEGGADLPPYTRTPGISALAVPPATARVEALVVHVWEGSRRIEGLPDGKLRKDLEALVATEAFRGRRGRTLVFHSAGRHAARRVIVAGLGRREEADAEAIRVAAGAALRRAGASGAATVAFTMPPAAGSVSSAARRARALADGCLLGAYHLRRYQTSDERLENGAVRSVRVFAAKDDLAEVREALKQGAIACGATNLARDIVNEPAMVLTPVRMAEIAVALAGKAGLECRVHDEKALQEMGMNAFLGVSRGSHQPPRFIHLVYRPEGEPVRRIALVGKGLTFDSGGLSLKTAQGMETMKLDKSGAVAVLAAMTALRETAPAVEVHGLLGMTENMPGGSAIKPGDILRTSGGRTIEVLNTDAEGRLVLADLLCYARTLKVDEVLDLATLTGACMVALGPLAAGVFGNHSDHVTRILEAAERAGEKMWPLPMYEDYRDQIRSEVADVKNTGDRYGGAITAALFLREFAGRRTRWIHFDIAGPAFLESSAHPYLRKGATGAGVRTLIEYIGSIRAR